MMIAANCLRARDFVMGFFEKHFRVPFLHTRYLRVLLYFLITYGIVLSRLKYTAIKNKKKTRAMLPPPPPPPTQSRYIHASAL